MKAKSVILVVDDQPQNIELLEAYLFPQGYEIVKAADGEEALQKLADHPVDLILLDVMMPDVDGFEVARRVRQNPVHRLLPIILVTALRETEARVKGIEAGCDDFISKPVDRMELIARVRSLLKVKAYNDLLSHYREELKTEVATRTEEIEQTFIFQQRLIDALPMPVFYKDAKGRYLGCNRAFESFFGRKKEQVTGQSAFTLSPKEFADRHQEEDLALLRNPGIQIYESVVKDAYGIIHNVIFHKATFPNKDGSVGGLIGALLDITERKRSEEALRDSESQYRLLADHANDVIFVLDLNLNYTYVSPSVKGLRGYEPDEVLQQTYTEVLTASSAELARKMFSEVLALEKTDPREDSPSRTLPLEMKRKDGTTVWTEVKFSLIRDDNQQLTGLLGVARDITERRGEIERIRKALGATVQAIAVTVETRDPYTAGHQRRVADLARAIAVEMGLPADRVEGIRVAATIHDLGKISVPAEILSKPTRLSAIEFMLIKTHSQSGFDILKDIDFPWPVARMVLEHHERMNGSGYPNGLTGGALLMESRILSVADVVEAMASFRPYRPALGLEAALNEISMNRGTFYDEAVSEACLRLFREKTYQIVD